MSQSRVRKPLFLIVICMLSLLLVGLPACSDDGDDNLSDGDSDGDVPTEDGDDSPDGDSDGDEPDGDADGDEDGDQADPTENYALPEAWLNRTISWSSCDLYEGETTSSQRAAECAYVEMPVDWSDPDGPTMDIKVKRLLQDSGATRQVWVLHGGPGGPGTTGLAFMADYLNQTDPKLDVYLLDHRGTGYSARIGCPQYEADDSQGGFSITNDEWPDCLDWLQSDWDYPLDAFTVTQAAIDVGYLVEISGREDREDFVYGISYGAYWGHRYGQLFPSQAKGIVLDSVPPSTPTYLEKYDLYANQNMLKLFAHCADDELCRAKLGADPAARAGEILQDFKDGHCSQLLTTYGINLQIWHYTLFTIGRDVYSRILVPALYYRLGRCGEGDVDAIVQAATRVVGGGASSVDMTSLASFADKQYGVALGNHIVLSEMLSDEPMTIAELKTAYEDLLVNNYLGLRMMQLAEFWPVYEWDGYVREWAHESVPFLMMNSSFDLQSPIEMAVSARDNLTGPHQYFVEIPDSNHGVITQSPVLTTGKPDCGAQIMISYMDDPLKTPDTSCLSDLRPIDFNGEPAYNKYYLGTANAWEDEAVSIDCGLPADFMTVPSENRLRFLFDGEIAEWQPGPGEMSAEVDDVEYDVDTYAVTADRRTSNDGVEIVAMMGYGNIQQLSAGELHFFYAETSISVNALNELKTSGEHRVNYHADKGEFFSFVAEINDKTVGQNRYVKICPKGILDFEDQNSALWVCHEQNTEFVRGEGFEAAGNVPLIYDADQIQTLFGTDEGCRCYQHGGDTFDCDDWASAGQAGARLKKRPVPQSAPRIALPPLPRYLPENMPEWRRNSL